jgi:hypothetical protein
MDVPKIYTINFHSLQKETCLAPEFKKKCARPKKKRIPSAGEAVAKQVHKCSICKKIGHKKNTCSNAQ